MKLHRLIPSIAVALLLAACADPNLAAGPRTTTDRFQLALADAYKDGPPDPRRPVFHSGSSTCRHKSGMR